MKTSAERLPPNRTIRCEVVAFEDAPVVADGAGDGLRDRPLVEGPGPFLGNQLQSAGQIWLAQHLTGLQRSSVGLKQDRGEGRPLPDALDVA